MNIHVHIERLVLDGLPVRSGEGAAVQMALEAELSRLLAEKGLDSLSAGAVPSLAVGSIQLAHETRPAHLGQQIARTIHTGIQPAPAVPRSTSTHGGTRA